MARQRTLLRLKTAALVAVMLGLAGCEAVSNDHFGGGTGGGGGGGGGGGSSLPTPDPLSPQQPASNFVDAEFSPCVIAGGTTYCDNGKGIIGAENAYAKGAYGGGVVVAVIDTGIDPTHTELDANISPLSTDIASPGTPLADDFGHGTMVAGVIAAERNGIATHGVAFDATILAVRADSRNPDGTSAGAFTVRDITASINYSAGKAHVINLSLGVPGTQLGDPFGSSPLEQAAFEQALTNAMASGAIIVAATGNESAAEAALPSAYAGDTTVNASGQMLAVGAVNSAGDALATFSNACGSAMDYCLVAPGQSIISTYPGDQWAVADGTSFAAPHVSGAAALLIQAWPMLPASDVVDILLTTATDMGVTGVDPVYGHGLLNLNAAVAPLGTLVIPVADSVTGETVMLQRTVLSLGSAFGDALDGSTLLGQAYALDDYDRNFAAGLDSRVFHNERDFGLQALLDGGIEPVESTLPNGMTLSFGATEPEAADRPAQWFGMAADAGPERSVRGMSVAMQGKGGTAWRLGYDVTPEQQLPGTAAGESASLFWMAGDMLGPQHALVGSGTAFSVSRSAGASGEVTLGLVEEGTSADGVSGDARLGEVVFAHRFAGGAVVTAGFSAIDEQDRFLGSSTAGGFAVEGANSRFYALGGRVPIGAGVELVGSYTLGEAEMTADGTSLLSDWSAARADAFGLGVVKRGIVGGGDRIGFLLGQPLRVNAATATLTAPVDYLIDKTVVQGSERVSLVPTGREIDVQLAYDRAVGPAGSVSGWLMMQLEPGHDTDADPAYGVGVRFKADF